MTDSMTNKLDFDYLTSLASANPSAFERLRQHAIDSYITALPEDRQERMRGLQWRIDQIRSLHSPMGACVKLSGMMWDHVIDSQGLLGQLSQKETPVHAFKKAQIIPFSSRRS